MNLKYAGDDQKIYKAIRLHRDLWGKLEFRSAIDSKKFKYASDPRGSAILTEIKSGTALGLVVEIKTYYPKWPWSKAIAYTEGKNIYFNARKLPSMKLEEIVNTLWHETVHIIDANSPLSFGHGTNTWTQDKQDHSAPYFIGALAERLVREGTVR